MNPKLLATDLEGVLIPEVWINVAEKTGIDDLKLTTRDISDYDELMGHRLKVCAKHGLTMTKIQEVISEMNVLPGAKAYLDQVREDRQVIILSDTFYEFAKPFMQKLGWPTLFCHSLQVDAQDQVVGYKLRLPDGKKQAVSRFQELGFSVTSIGDSYNDTTMLGQADEGILFRAPKNVLQEFPMYPAYTEYQEVLKHLQIL